MPELKRSEEHFLLVVIARAQMSGCKPEMPSFYLVRLPKGFVTLLLGMLCFTICLSAFGRLRPVPCTLLVPATM